MDCCGIEWINQDTRGFLSVMSAVVAVFSYRDQDPQKLKTAEVLRTLKSSNLGNTILKIRITMVVFLYREVICCITV